MKFKKIVFFFALFFSITSSSLEKLKSNSPNTKLILVLVYDQMRADYLTKFQKQFLPAQQKNNKLGGFNFLIQNGAYFPLSEYKVLQNMTCPGHAMILTGSYPYANGIPLNDWYDSESHRLTYCAEDEVDQISPRKLKASTVGDEIKMNIPASRVFTLALKDRSAVMLGGHAADAAIWLSKEKLTWETSSYYKNKSKNWSWLEDLNKDFEKSIPSEYVWNGKKTGQDFFKKYSTNSNAVIGTPYGGEITTRAAIEMIKKLKLGQGPSTDLFAISFSSHDIAGHGFGPNSPEMESMTLYEDQQLSELLNTLQKQLPTGLKDVSIVLTADHGVAPTTITSQKNGIDADFIDQDKLMDKLNAYLDKKFGKPKLEKTNESQSAAENQNKNWIVDYKSFNFYLNPDLEDEKEMQKKNHLDEKVKQYLTRQPGIFDVITKSDYQKGLYLPEIMGEQTKSSYIPGVSGQYLIIPKPFWYEKSKNPATHMTGYSYDRTVPLIFYGKGFIKGVYSKTPKINDIAPTLSFVLGLVPPALSEGRVLDEIIKK